jgi:dTDP-4-amino-4,6-dideoxygalactose transaminase
MELKKVDFESVRLFEEKIAEFFGAPYAVAVDSCTHGVELSLRYKGSIHITVPKRTYLSIPFLADKLNIDLYWDDRDWIDYYYLNSSVIDAAVLWKKDSYIANTFMSISFQYQKHLNLSRGGIILTDDYDAWLQLKKMSYDGRLPGIPWREQDIDTVGYHYYMPPETALLGLSKLQEAIDTPPKQWVVTDWPNLLEMSIFKNKL